MPEQTGNGTVAIWGIEQPRALSPNLLEKPLIFWKYIVNLSMRNPGRRAG